MVQCRAESILARTHKFLSTLQDDTWLEKVGMVTARERKRERERESVCVREREREIDIDIFSFGINIHCEG